jgi:hypothetical protein
VIDGDVEGTARTGGEEAVEAVTGADGWLLVALITITGGMWPR